jgi:hypothetical protein
MIPTLVALFCAVVLVLGILTLDVLLRRGGRL